MRTPRFFAGAQPLAPGMSMTLPEGAFRHAVQVLRLRPGARLVLFNGDGRDYAARLVAVERRQARVDIEDSTPNETESCLQLHLVQAVSKSEHMDLSVQKAVELGVQRIQTVSCERGLHIPAARLARKMAHWHNILIHACEQCGRSRLPDLAASLPLANWLRTPPPADGLRLFLDPRAETRLADLPCVTGAIEILIGPEGGFSPEEQAAAAAAGAVGLKLGPRILRTETAGIAVLAALQARWGDMG